MDYSRYCLQVLRAASHPVSLAPCGGIPDGDIVGQRMVHLLDSGVWWDDADAALRCLRSVSDPVLPLVAAAIRLGWHEVEVTPRSWAERFLEQAARHGFSGRRLHVRSATDEPAQEPAERRIAS